jgi:transcriptional regulator with XRE-family HTH domain
MPTLVKGSLLRYLRERRKWSQAELTDRSGFSELNLSRLESNRHNPGEDIFTSLLFNLGMDADSYFCSFFDNPNTRVYAMKHQLTQELYWCQHYPARQNHAEALIDTLRKTEGFGEGINKQYILSCIARLHMIQHKSPEKILDMVNEGIRLTYEDFDPNDIKGDALLFNEPQLIHIQALAHSRTGAVDKAIRQLQQLESGMSRLPQDDRTKETLLVPILLDYARLLTEKGDYDAALVIYDRGNELSIKRYKGKYTPDFTFDKAKTLYLQGKEKNCADLLLPAYMGYSVLRLPQKMQEVLNFAEKIGCELNTYGVEHLAMDLPKLDGTFGDTDIKPCNTFGNFIRNLRYVAGLTAEEVCEGLCNPSVLYKLENSNGLGITSNIYLLEAFMQRLGRHMDSYFDTFMSLKDFEHKELRTEINSLLTRKRVAEAETLLATLAKKPEFLKHAVNLQFIKTSEAMIYGRKENKDDDTHMKMLLDAIYTTKPRYDERNIAKTRLTHFELITVNQMAILTCQKGDLLKGTRMFEDLLTGMDAHIYDEPERMRMYLIILSNYVKFIGFLGLHKEALELATKGDEMCTKHGYLKNASTFALSKAWYLCELGDEKTGKPVLAQSFYTTGLIGNGINQKAAAKYAKERFDMEFV